nr:adenine deaminase C-terminal domain-containing protein [Peribacillus cavernae]
MVTRHLTDEVKIDKNGAFETSIDRNLLKLAVIERHHMTHNIGLGIVKGLGLTSRAIATTVSHDSHNLINAGANDADMLAAAEVISAIQGGVVIISHGKILAALELPLAG